MFPPVSEPTDCINWVSQRILEAANSGVRPNAVALFVEIRRKFGVYFSCDRQKNSLAFQRSFFTWN